MAELIDKGAFIADIKSTIPQGASRGVFLALIDDTPTVTEAEIRAKVIEEFAEKLKEESVWTDGGWCVPNVVIADVAKQLKGE